MNKDVMNCDFLFDEELSLKAKGLMSLLIQLPIEQLNKNLLLRFTKEGQRSLDSTLNELKEKGYLEINRVPRSSGFKWEYIIYPNGIENRKESKGN